MAVQYHTARFRLVPSLAQTLDVLTPAVRKPGSLWIELPRPAMTGTEPPGHARIGHARASTVRQCLDAQFASLKAAGVTRVLSEKIPARATIRSNLTRSSPWPGNCGHPRRRHARGGGRRLRVLVRRPSGPEDLKIEISVMNVT